jgi:hypothetical protein
LLITGPLKRSERYRDLLEASSAIVHISEASKRVLETLEEMKDACDTSQEVRSLQHTETGKGHRKHQSVWGLPSLHGRTAAQGMPSLIEIVSLINPSSSPVSDSQLVTLQSLAAHLKLLLDTPEQLWRLLERKRFLHAAWLYLLARVVYRALAHDEDEDEDRDVQWSREGIQVTVRNHANLGSPLMTYVISGTIPPRQTPMGCHQLFPAPNILSRQSISS